MEKQQRCVPVCVSVVDFWRGASVTSKAAKTRGKSDLCKMTSFWKRREKREREKGTDRQTKEKNETKISKRKAEEREIERGGGKRAARRMHR